jgi:hypothetical protein
MVQLFFLIPHKYSSQSTCNRWFGICRLKIFIANELQVKYFIQRIYELPQDVVRGCCGGARFRNVWLARTQLGGFCVLSKGHASQGIVFFALGLWKTRDPAKDGSRLKRRGA